jgi:hypothetical protein
MAAAVNHHAAILDYDERVIHAEKVRYLAIIPAIEYY